ncbi:MAG: redoxin domain-containing protein [Proteobacteria bacterium]|nr:redoxin domain-containing protein [Pseudomonadota bacterium]
MPDNLSWIMGAAVFLLAAGAWIFLKKKRGPPIPDALRPGEQLPDFAATDEQGNPVRSAQLIGSPTVMLFVRGNWCPFCTRQVEALTTHYKEIVDLGARLIFVTPKPLETTRRVADFFEVEFDFWMDDQLNAVKQLGLLMPASVPGDHRKEYGADTVWPTALVIDAAGIIKFSKLSRLVVDRPNPKVLLDELRKLQG